MTALNVCAAFLSRSLLVSPLPTGLLKQLLVLVFSHFLLPPLTHRAHKSCLSYNHLPCSAVADCILAYRTCQSPPEGGSHISCPHLRGVNTESAFPPEYTLAEGRPPAVSYHQCLDDKRPERNKSPHPHAERRQDCWRGLCSGQQDCIPLLVAPL